MSKRTFDKEPLYRKVNTRTRGVFHNTGPDYRNTRNTKSEKLNEASRGKMRQGAQRGLDYTPLFRFLLSRVGQPFDAVYSEAKARLDRDEPIFWLVARNASEEKRFVCVSENAHYNGLKIDSAGLLQCVDPSVENHELWPSCPCCTHTFNGVPFINSYDESKRYSNDPSPL